MKVVAFTFVLLTIVDAYRTRPNVLWNAAEYIVEGLEVPVPTLLKHTLQSDKLRVNLLVTRHALSCANIVHSNGGRTSWQHSRMLDPSISQCGVDRARRAAEAVAVHLQNRTIDFVLSSSLTRAMETAIHQYPEHLIIPVPYLSEKSPGYDNRPADVDSQIASLSTRYPYVHGRINFEWMRHRVWGEARHRYNEPSFASFLAFLVEDFLPRIAFDGNEVTIAVVTHSHFMKDEEPIASHCSSLWDADTGKPRNNQVVEMSYDVDRANMELGVSVFPMRNATLLAVGGQYCRDVFTAFPKIDPRMLCDRDIGNVCRAEVDSLSWAPHLLTKEQEIGKVTLRHEQAISALDSDMRVNRTSRAYANQAVAERAQEDLDQLLEHPCCVA